MQVVENGKSKKFVRVGSLWQKSDKNGNQFLSGSLDINDCDRSFKKDKDGNDKEVVFLSIHKNKKTSPNQPDFNLYQLKETNEEFLKPDENLDMNLDDDLPDY